MRPIEQATERLNLAIERLEEAIAREPNGKAEKPSKELAGIEADRASLQKVVDTVAHRLDTAIGRLKLILES